MTILTILTAPHPFLKKKAKPVTAFDEHLAQTAKDMLETMYDADGIDKRMLVMDVDRREDKSPKPIIVINPIITWLSDEMSSFKEGCLSVPSHYSDVIRPAEIKINYQDLNGNEQSLHADGLLATCLQHEMDHLDGILFLDHLSALKRTIILRKMIKSKATS